MKLEEFYKKNKINEGMKISFEYENELLKGIIIPSKKNLKIKFDSGYNAGFDLKKINKIKILEKGKEVGKATLKKIEKNPNLETISLLHTGGTIASRVDYRTGGVYASFEADDLANMFPELLQIANFDSILISNMMSEDMTEQDYLKISKAVEKEIKKGVKGIIIGHGTDTLGYSSAFLSFALENCPVPVILVGAQRSSDRGSSDAGMNLICAAEFITKTDFTGVAICMHNSSNDDKCAILPATKTRKMHTSRRDAFKTINDTPIALVDYKTRKIEFLKTIQKPNKKFELKEKFDSKVGLIKMHPGINVKIIEFYIKEKYNGLIIEGTGLGHTPLGKKDIFIKKIKELKKNGCIVAMTSQCINGRVHPHVYSTARFLKEAGVIYCEDMLAETALIKLSWLLGNYSKKETKELLNKNLRGEITPFTNVNTFEY